LGIQMQRRIISRPWTPEDVDLLRGLAGNRIPSRIIAAKLRRTLGAIQARASAEGIPLNGGRRVSQAGSVSV